MNKKELKKLEQLKDKSHQLQRQVSNLEYKRMVELALPNLRKFIGKCFKYHNSYGSQHERWWLYSKVISVDEKNMMFNCIEFQRTSLEKIEIELEKKFNFNGENFFTRMSGYIEITANEYNLEKRKLKKFVIEKLEL